VGEMGILFGRKPFVNGIWWTGRRVQRQKTLDIQTKPNSKRGGGHKLIWLAILPAPKFMTKGPEFWLNLAKNLGNLR
jgi:hypothetical protein